MDNTWRSKKQTSLLDQVTRPAARAALFLDLIATIIRVGQVLSQLTLPDAYAAYAAHADPVLAALYYGAGIEVVLAIALGVTAGAFLSFRLIYLINRRIAAAHKIRTKRTRQERLKMLEARLSRYAGLRNLSVVPLVLFGIPYFFASLDIPGMNLFDAVTGVAAPVIILYVVSQTEQEADNIDAEEIMQDVTTRVVVSQAEKIAERVGGKITPQDALMLSRAADGDLPGVIEAGLPRNEAERYYTITEICARFGVSPHRDSPDRKKLYRIAADARRNGEMEIVRDLRRGILVPSRLFDKLFGDFQPRAVAVAVLPGGGQTVAAARPALRIVGGLPLDES